MGVVAPSQKIAIEEYQWHFRASKYPKKKTSGGACSQIPLATCASGVPSPCLPTQKYLATARSAGKRNNSSPRTLRRGSNSISRKQLTHFD